jgi:hypothetical protein
MTLLKMFKELSEEVIYNSRSKLKDKIPFCGEDTKEQWIVGLRYDNIGKSLAF